MKKEDNKTDLAKKPAPKPKVRKPKASDLIHDFEIDIIKSIPIYDRFITFLRSIWKKSKLQLMFDLKDEGGNAQKSIEIAFAIHLILLILIIFPYDKLYVKNIVRPSGVFVKLQMISKPNPNGNNIAASNLVDVQSNQKALDKSSAAALNPKSDAVVKGGISSLLDDINSKVRNIIDKKPETKKATEAKQVAKNSSANSQNSPDGTGIKDAADDAQDINSVTSHGEMDSVQNGKQIIAAQLHACWTATQVNSQMPPGISVDVVLHFSSDGNIQTYNILPKQYANPNQALAYSTAVDSARQAISNCRYIKGLSVNTYDSWKVLNVSFKYSKIDL